MCLSVRLHAFVCLFIFEALYLRHYLKYPNVTTLLCFISEMGSVQLQCELSLLLCDSVFFSSPETSRTKTTDYTFEEKIGVLFRFNAGNYFYELKNEFFFLVLSPKALSDDEYSESMHKDLSAS